MISVIVPIYNVEPFLQECLDSIARQTVTDLDVVMVDDGSTDGSAAIASARAAADSRFRLVQQDNAGLGTARNTGVEHARGDHLAFVDSDDLVPPTGYARLLASLERTGSDFASGNARRLWSHGSRRTALLAPVCARNRARTHIREFPLLIRDRVAWNKLFQRAFWDRHGFRFGEGVTYEDIYVTLPAHHLARTVDVLSAPVYYWRIRESGPLSISQRRTEVGEMGNRIAAIHYVSRWLSDQGMATEKQRYDDTVLTDDLRFFFVALSGASEADQLVLLDEVNAFFDQTDDSIFDRLPALRRLAWHLVRRRSLPEVLEVFRFERDDRERSAPEHRRRHWYGDYPFRSDRRLAVPRDIYRIDDELSVVADVQRLALDGTILQVRGHASIPLLDPATDVDAIEVVAMPTRDGVARPMAVSRHTDGFVASLDLRETPAGEWQIAVSVRQGGVQRKAERLKAASLHAVDPVDAGDRRAVAGLAADGRLLVEVGRPVARLRSLAIEKESLVVVVGCPAAVPAGAVLQMGRAGGRRHRFPLDLVANAAGDAVARLPLAELTGELAEPDVPERAKRQGLVGWELAVRGPADGPWPVVGTAEQPLDASGQEWLATSHRVGRTLLVQRQPRPVVSSVEWLDDALRLTGRLGPAGGSGPITVVAADVDATCEIEPVPGPAQGTFGALLPGSAVAEMSAATGPWVLRASVDAALRARLPLRRPGQVHVAAGIGDFGALVVGVLR